MHIFQAKINNKLLKTGKSYIKTISWAYRISFMFILIFHFLKINSLRLNILVNILFNFKKLSTFSLISNKTFTLRTRLLRVCKWCIAF